MHALTGSPIGELDCPYGEQMAASSVFQRLITTQLARRFCRVDSVKVNRDLRDGDVLVFRPPAHVGVVVGQDVYTVGKERVERRSASRVMPLVRSVWRLRAAA